MEFTVLIYDEAFALRLSLNEPYSMLRCHYKNTSRQGIGIHNIGCDDSYTGGELWRMAGIAVYNMMEKFFRITSYNVCYTKLLRTRTVKKAVNAHATSKIGTVVNDGKAVPL